MDELIDDIWHVFSDGTRADIPFNTVEDKVFGWNSVAICAEIAGVRVWVVTVNDTHFHSLIKGSEERADPAGMLRGFWGRGALLQEPPCFHRFPVCPQGGRGGRQAGNLSRLLGIPEYPGTAQDG